MAPLFGRRLARSQALQLLFQAEATGESVEDVLRGDYAVTDGSPVGEDSDVALVPVESYGEALARGVEDHLEALDAAINDATHNWNIGRMGAVDRNLMRIALYEMVYEPEVDPSVSIDEAVDLARHFGQDNSSSFVNGVLGRLATNLENGAYEDGLPEPSLDEDAAEDDAGSVEDEDAASDAQSMPIPLEIGPEGSQTSSGDDREADASAETAEDSGEGE